MIRDLLYQILIAFLQNALKNVEKIEWVGSGLLLLSAVSHIPENIPRQAQDFWTWMRSTFQTALPISRLSNIQTQIISATPTTPAKLEQRMESTNPIAPVEPASKEN